MTLDLDQHFWEKYYSENHTPWDMGRVSPPLAAYFDQLNNRAQKILIPGAGNAHEAEYLWRRGFKNVFIAEIALKAIKNFKKRVTDFPADHILHCDFFEIQETFDLIIEQTFFCALEPSYRLQYARHMHRLLNPGGKLVGLLFDFPLDPENPKPPFGGSGAEYKSYFDAYFQYVVFETASNSHPARQDREIFMILTKKVDHF